MLYCNSCGKSRNKIQGIFIPLEIKNPCSQTNLRDISLKGGNLKKMAKLSEKYETMVVFSLKDGEEQIEGLKEKFTTLIESNAELISVNEWGKRRLAYPINYEIDGYYVLYGFDCKPDFPMELERVLNITEGILRFLTVVRVDAPAKPVPEESEEVAEGKPEEVGEVAEAEETTAGVPEEVEEVSENQDEGGSGE